MTGTTPEPPSDGTGHERGPETDWAAVVFALLVILAGGYFLLRDTLHIGVPEISWDAAWPVLVIVLGLLVLARGLAGRRTRHRRR